MALYGTVLLPVLKKHPMIETDSVSTVILDVSAQQAKCSRGLKKYQGKVRFANLSAKAWRVSLELCDHVIYTWCVINNYELVISCNIKSTVVGAMNHLLTPGNENLTCAFEGLLIFHCMYIRII